MNFYMNVSATYPDELGRKLYQEIGMIEEQHVTHYGSLLNPGMTWLENLLVHQYVECWLYWSCHETETVPHIRQTWAMLLEQELTHLRTAENLLKQYEGKQWQQVIPDGNFPEPLKLESNIDYVRGVLASSVQNTTCRENYVDVADLPPRSDFSEYQKRVNGNVQNVTSHAVIEQYIAGHGQDYRFETAPNPIHDLRYRTKDNTDVGRKPVKSLTHA